MPRVLLLLPTTTYRTDAFLETARRFGADVVVASEQPSTMEALTPAGLLTLDFSAPEQAAQVVADLAKDRPFDAVVPVDDDTAVVAAAIGARLGLPHNSVQAAAAARDKSVSRELLRRHGVPAPRFAVVDGGADPIRVAAAAEIGFPCVVKPVFLAASRGVIRADSPAALAAAVDRDRRLLADPELRRRGGALADRLLVEEYVPGREVALEGLLQAGRLRALALFDKPDPLEGPYFEETIYVTPSRLPTGTQHAVEQCAARAAAALGLSEGPVHAELRVNESGPWVLEVAARSIGGLCSRALRFGPGLSLEELILRAALGRGVDGLVRELDAAGVMMIPIPRAGVLREVRGIEAAKEVPDVQDVVISAHRGASLVPLPEAASYLGFIFSRAATPERVEAALREAHARLEIVIEVLGGGFPPP